MWFWNRLWDQWDRFSERHSRVAFVAALLLWAVVCLAVEFACGIYYTLIPPIDQSDD